MASTKIIDGEMIIVDDDNADLLSQNGWRIRSSGRSSRTSKTRYVVRTDGKNLIGIHRIILSAKPGEIVDHINGNPFDNRRENLRIASNAENVRNSRKRRSLSTTSIYKGVGYERKKGKWRATITVDCRTIHLGYFEKESEAAIAYDVASVKYHGDFGRRNFSSN